MRNENEGRQQEETRLISRTRDLLQKLPFSPLAPWALPAHRLVIILLPSPFLITPNKQTPATNNSD